MGGSAIDGESDVGREDRSGERKSEGEADECEEGSRKIFHGGKRVRRIRLPEDALGELSGGF